MNNLQVIGDFEILDSKTLTIYGDKDNPLFLAKDIAEWIDYSKTSEGYYNVSKMLMTIDEDEKMTITNNNSGGTKLFLTEDGLYEVLMQSRKPIAKQFKKKVKVVLKTIRQTGGYIPVDKDMDDAEIMARALLIAQNTIEKKDKLITELQPKADVYDMFIDTDTTFGFRELRKELESALGISIKENYLKDVMRQKGWIGKTVKALSFATRNGYMVSKDRLDKFGNHHVQDRFTMKAREELISEYLN